MNPPALSGLAEELAQEITRILADRWRQPMPRSQAEIQTALDQGLRTTFDGWAQADGPIYRNIGIPFIVVPDSLDEVRLDGMASTSQGYRVFEIAAARTGLQTYIDAAYPGGRRVEMRRLEDVTAPASLASWLHAPLTIGHHGMVTMANSEALKQGYIFAGPRIERLADGEDYLIFACVADHRQLIDGLDRKELVEGSAGYACLFMPHPGEHRGQKFDGYQTQILINHVAMLPAGRARAGHLARVQDATDTKVYFVFTTDKGDPPPMTTEQKVLRQVRLDAATAVNLDPADADKVQARLDSLTGQIQTLTEQVTTLTTERDTQRGRADSLDTAKQALEQQLADAQDQAKQAIDKVGKAFAEVLTHLPELKADSLPEFTERAVYAAYLADAKPGVDFSAESDDYVRAAAKTLMDAGPAQPKLGSGQPTPGAKALFDSMRPASGGQRQDQAPAPNPYHQQLVAPTQNHYKGGESK